MPIVLGNGHFFGTLCAIDPEPQSLTAQQADLLVVLGRIIATQIERDQELATRRQAEAEQEQLYRATQEAVRQREALLSIASHELKNPLTALLGYAHLMQRRALDDDHVSDRDQFALQTIIAQAERLSRMLDDLLDVSRVDSGQLIVERLPLDLSTLVYDVVDELRPIFVNHPVTIVDTDNLIMVRGDADRLAQVLRNLLGNAVKYSPAGGPITITIDVQHEQASLSIRDQGIGIPASAVPNLFQRFYRAPNTAAHSISGFGIGLYVVKEIVSRHDGTVTVTSDEGSDTTFTILLPLSAPLG